MSNKLAYVVQDRMKYGSTGIIGIGLTWRKANKIRDNYLKQPDPAYREVWLVPVYVDKLVTDADIFWEHA